MKKVFLILALMSTALLNAQTDSTVVDTTDKEPMHFYEIDLLSRNVWRGIDFGNGSPSIVGVIGIAPFKGFEVGAFGITTLMGTNVGYGNTFNVYASYKYKFIKLTVDDYYFNGDASNLVTKYEDWEDTHFLEARLELDHKGFYVMGSYTLAGGEIYNIETDTFNNTQGVYIEAGYKGEHFTILAGGITGPSALNFHDKEGVINTGIKYTNVIEKLNDLPFEIGIFYNPNFDNIAPVGLPRIGYGQNAFNFTVAIIL
jgi:hypothetical protein